MRSLHPLARRILAAVGASSAAAALFAGGAASTLGSACCPPPEDTGPYVASLGDACTVMLDSSLVELVEKCEVVQAAVCPPFDEVTSTASLKCGPLRPGEPATVGPSSSSSSGNTGGSGGAGAGGSGMGAGGSGGMGGAGGGATQIICCYGAVQGPYGQGCGRPLVVDGRALTSAPVQRSDWRAAASDEPPLDLAPHLRAELAERWSRDAALEHASVASFARFVLDLLAVGAPADLVRGADEAMRDEIDHAERCYAMASRYAGRATGPGPLPLEGVTAGGEPLEIAARALVEGCVGETVAAIVAQRTLDVTSDRAARRALDVIARDEAAHAELAFRFVAWAARAPDVRAGLRRALPCVLERALAAYATPRATADDAALESHGQPGDGLRGRAARDAITEIVTPCLSALLDEQGNGLGLDQRP